MVVTASANHALLERAEAVMPGGVSSPVRAYRAVGGEPPFIARGSGARVWDEDGREYLDLVCSWGPLILGHAHPAVVRAVRDQAELGTSFGAPTAGEVELAETIVRAVASVEMLRFVSSGTEATMSALRVARAVTHRDRIVKFAGCYHGHSDALLAKAGSGIATFGLPDSAGVSRATAADTIVVEYNDPSACEAAIDERVAAVIVEPFAGNMGCVPPAPGFLDALRSMCDRTGALLIFDEVITGFRVARGGAQELCGVRPDLSCFGKVIGGGLPVGAYGGSRALMSVVAPLGPAYQAGTLSGNPLAMAAGIATLAQLDALAYARLEALGARLQAILEAAARAANVPAVVQRTGSLLTLFFTDRPVTCDGDTGRVDRARFATFHRGMRGLGMLLPPSQLECWFLSLAHTDADVDAIGAAAAATLEEIAR
ncbi:MAG TPA: glutamate-1-semialdehyde 2,1-aminomutase [Candidatus Limnocylindria bacterium]|nr:glutamate-1-semialdehyde 2,1-aminomutase [Candidatus Limnocylindria bacterium]